MKTGSGAGAAPLSSALLGTLRGQALRTFVASPDGDRLGYLGVAVRGASLGCNVAYTVYCAMFLAGASRTLARNMANYPWESE